MLKRGAYWICLGLWFSPALLFAQAVRPACTLLAALDLKPLLGPDQGAPAPYADEACIVKSKTPGRLVMLTLVEKPPAELKSNMAAFRKTMQTAEYAKSVAVAAVPELGPDAFAVREKGEQSAAEIHALKGAREIQITLNWSDGKITEPLFKQLRELAAAALSRLP